MIVNELTGGSTSVSTITIVPNVALSCICPVCSVSNEPVDWYMPGMRQMGRYQCGHCSTSYVADLPTGAGLLHAYCLNWDTGEIAPAPPSWFAEEMIAGYNAKTETPIELKIERLRPAQDTVIVNCLDTYYGHALVKLLNVQRYIEAKHDVIVITPAYLRWLVPINVAEIWTVKVGLRASVCWYDALDQRFHDECARFSRVRIAVTRSPLDQADYEIVNFTRIHPFPREEWEQRLERPTVTYIWREDRFWPHPGSSVPNKVLRRTARIVAGKSIPKRVQTRAVVALAERVRRAFPRLDFAVTGIGSHGDLPNWIHDQRYDAVDEAVERSWCARYAASHLVLGVHGSNMLLPSALAGATISIVPQDRYGNFAQDILLSPHVTGREVMLFYRFMPIESNVNLLAHATVEVLRKAHQLQRELTLGL